MPVALISTSTSPSRGPSSCTVSIRSFCPASKATAARTSISVSPASRAYKGTGLPKGVNARGVNVRGSDPSDENGCGLRVHADELHRGAGGQGEQRAGRRLCLGGDRLPTRRDMVDAGPEAVERKLPALAGHEQ